jgi:hypothetical protein
MAKPPQLVCQHLENISRDALEKYQKIIRTYVRKRQGVYALYRRGKLYYVGLASDLNWRLKHHLRDRHRESWSRFSVYLTIGDSHLRELESLLLRVVQPKPPGNKQGGKFRQSENLRRRFMKDVRRLQRSELDSLVGRTVVEEPVGTQESGKRRKPVLAKFVDRPTELRATLKGRSFKARVRRDGFIRFKGKLYRSPSHAGQAACKRSCNGWWFWKYERAPGDWVRLKELRK